MECVQCTVEFLCLSWLWYQSSALAAVEYAFGIWTFLAYGFYYRILVDGFFFLFDWYICWCDEKKSYISQRNVFSFSFFDVQCNMMLFTYITSSFFSFSHRSKFFFTSLTFAFQMRTIHVFLKDSFAKWSVIVMILWHPYFHPTNAQRECA